jgi:uncharacterized membrane protein (DUF2068 family)
MTTEDARAPEPRFGMLRYIALYKLVKVVLLLVAAYLELRLHDRALSTKLLTWAEARPQGLEHHALTWVLTQISGMNETALRALRAGTFTYAALFAIEGIGLWMRKRWAEWLTVIITASLIPVEIYEFALRPNLGKAAVVIANAGIVAYLIWHVRSRGRETPGGAPVAPSRTMHGGVPADRAAGASGEPTDGAAEP